MRGGEIALCQPSPHGYDIFHGGWPGQGRLRYRRGMSDEKTDPTAMPARPEPPWPQWVGSVVVTDSHCHLNDVAFADDVTAVLARARARGVKLMIDVGATQGLEANHRALALAETEPGVFATVGIHPHEAASVTPDLLAEIERLSAAPKVVAIGETGLDYHYDHSPRRKQQEVFRAFIGLARRRCLPLTVHLREAHADAVRILREERASEVGGVIHCFTGSWEEARDFLDLGFAISLSGVVTFKSAHSLREAARRLPGDAVLVETDAPYLAPVPLRGRRNEPGFVVFTVACLAEVRGVAAEDLAEATTENAARVFRLDRSRA